MNRGAPKRPPARANQRPAATFAEALERRRAGCGVVSHLVT
jgi:hypothetical protein